MSISVNFYNSIKQFGNNYINDIERTYKHKVTYSIVEKELFGKNSTDSITHDLDKLILFIFGLPRKFISSIHRRYSEHHIESNKSLNLKSIVCDNISSSPYFKKDKQYSLREYFKNSNLNKIEGLKELLEKFNYGEDLNFEKIKKTVSQKYTGMKGILKYLSEMIKLLVA